MAFCSVCGDPEAQRRNFLDGMGTRIRGNGTVWLWRVRGRCGFETGRSGSSVFHVVLP